MPYLKKEQLVFNVISLRDNITRREELNEAVKKHDFQIQYHLVDRHPEGGVKGCRESHLTLYRYCVSANLPFIAIMEDDPRVGVNFEWFWTSPASESLYTLLFEMNSDKWPCEVVLLGSCLWPKTRVSPTEMKGLYHTFQKTHTCLCYIINQRACRQMLLADEANKLPAHIDVALPRMTRQWLVRPLLFHHKANKSNINSLVADLNLFRRFYHTEKGNVFAENFYYNGWMYLILQCMMCCLIVLFIVSYIFNRFELKRLRRLQLLTKQQ